MLSDFAWFCGGFVVGGLWVVLLIHLHMRGLLVRPAWWRLRSVDRSDPTEHEWCIAQELLPFGYRIDGTYSTRFKAEQALAREGSTYLKVYRLDFIRSENARLNNTDEFNAELRRYGRGDHG